MKNLSILLLCLFFVKHCKAQDTIYFKKPDLFKRNYIEIGIGNPAGTLANKYNYSTNIGYYVRNKINHDQFIDFGLELNFLVGADSINYKFKKEIVMLQSNNIGLHLDMRYSRIIYFSKNHATFNIESNTGVGWSAFFYKISKTLNKGTYDFNSNINTIHCSQTLKLNYKSLGIYLQLKYFPTSLFNKNIDDDFGQVAYSFGLVKGFNL